MRVLDLGGGFTAGDPAAPSGALGTAVPAAINAALVSQALMSLLSRHPRSQTTILLTHDVEPKLITGSPRPTLLQPAKCVLFLGSNALSHDACRMRAIRGW